MKILPKLIYRFNSVPIKISKEFFVNMNKLVLKYRWKWKDPRIAKIILRRTELLAYINIFQEVVFWSKVTP